MTDDPQLEALARDLHAIRAEPDPDFARELDERAADWLREGERRRRIPSLRIAVPALAAATTLVIALIVVGGESNNAERLDIAVIPADAAGGEALSAPTQRDSGVHEEAEGTLLVRVHNPGDGDVVEVSYAVTERTQARVRLGDREAAVDVPAGGGKLDISTEGLSPGSHDLEVTIPPIPTYRAPVEIRTPG
jgi:hypothetical protein